MASRPCYTYERETVLGTVRASLYVGDSAHMDELEDESLLSPPA